MLYTDGGKKAHGAHQFIVQTRDLETHEPLPGWAITFLNSFFRNDWITVFDVQALRLATLGRNLRFPQTTTVFCAWITYACRETACWWSTRRFVAFPFYKKEIFPKYVFQKKEIFGEIGNQKKRSCKAEFRYIPGTYQRGGIISIFSWVWVLISNPYISGACVRPQTEFHFWGDQVGRVHSPNPLEGQLHRHDVRSVSDDLRLSVKLGQLLHHCHTLLMRPQAGRNWAKVCYFLAFLFHFVYRETVQREGSADSRLPNSTTPSLSTTVACICIHVCRSLYSGSVLQRHCRPECRRRKGSFEFSTVKVIFTDLVT